MGFKLSEFMNAQPTERKEFKTLEPGLYMARIEKAEAKTAGTGTQYIALELAVKDIPDGNSKGKLWDNLYFTAKNAYVVANFLQALGLNDVLDEEFEIGQVASLITKHDVLINTKIEPAHDNYKERARIDTNGPMYGFASLDEVGKWYDIIVEGKEPEMPVELNDFNSIAPEAPEEVDW